MRKAQRFLPLRATTVRTGDALDLGRLVDMPEGYAPTNPTFLDIPEGRLVCVRGVNYRLADSVSMTARFTTGDTYHSVNRFILLDATGRPEKLPALDDAFAGGEDVRLFAHEGQVHALFSRQFAHPAGHACEMVLARIAPDRRSATMTALVSPYGFRQEKNWSPFSANGSIHFLYSLDPLIVLRLNAADMTLAFADPAQAEVPATALNFLLSGSGAGISFGISYLFVGHRRTVRLPRLNKIYLHRFAALGPRFDSIRFGRWFTIDRDEIQFVAGFGLVGDDGVRLSYGREDASAHIAVVTSRGLLPHLSPK